VTSRDWGQTGVNLTELLYFLLWKTHKFVPFRRFNKTLIFLSRKVRDSFVWWCNIPYETYAWRCAEGNCRPGDVVLDVGANIGIITILMSRRVGSTGTVYAIEPNPSVHSILVENLKMNRCRNVVRVQAAIGDRLGTTDFSVAPWEYHTMSGMVANVPGALTIRVPETTVDELMKHSSRVDYIKVDVEGAELRVLRGSRVTMQKFHPLLQIEVHGMFLPSYSDSIDDLFGMLEEHGYRAHNLVDNLPVSAEEFKKNTKVHGPHPLNGTDLAYQAYGQLLFIHPLRLVRERV
jgi:FkbM family methyltransferase